MVDLLVDLSTENLFWGSWSTMIRRKIFGNVASIRTNQELDDRTSRNLGFEKSSRNCDWIKINHFLHQIDYSKMMLEKKVDYCCP